MEYEYVPITQVSIYSFFQNISIIYVKDAAYTIMKIHGLKPHGIFKERHTLEKKKTNTPYK